MSDLSRPAGTTELLDGTTHDVLHLDGDGWELVERFEAGEVKASELYATAQRMVPTAPPSEITRLNKDQMALILQIAAGTVKQVRDDNDPNGDRPTEGAVPATPSSA